MAERTPSNDKAAFGVFPQLKRNRSKQDREAAKNVPVDLARGAVAGVLGAPGDIESLIRMLPYIDEKTVLPTSEDIEKKLPFKSDTPVSRAATGLGTLGGGFYYGPGSPLRVVGALPSAIKRGAQDFALASAAGAPHVIKPKGGNWLSGQDRLTVPENDLRRLKTLAGSKQREAELLAEVEEATKMGDQGYLNAAMGDLQRVRGYKSVNDWIDRNLTNYVKKEMGTPDDPVRRLAEEGIIHTPLREDLDRMDYLKAIREAEGYPAEGMGKSELAKQWEALSDDSIRVTRAGAIQDQANTGAKLEKARAELEAHKKQIDQDFLARMSEHTGNSIFSPKEAEMLLNMPFVQKAEILGDTKYRDLQGNVNELLARESGFEKAAGDLNPFVAKLDPETRLYSGSTYDLGFDHIVDVLREDVMSGRIRPEQLNKVSMEQAVRRTYEYDQEMAKKMQEAALKQTEGFPTYKEYPEGYRWLELAPPKQLPTGYSVVKDDMTGSYRVVDETGKEAVDRPVSNLGHINVPFHKTEDEAIAEALKYDKRLEEALQYEGNTMGHCVGGYCPDVSAGRSRIFSLRDAKGEPHVTVEVDPTDNSVFLDAVEKKTGLSRNSLADRQAFDAAVKEMSEDPSSGAFGRIVQIKGKQNAKPKEQYLPYVQDFVKGGNWSEIGDLRNTGLTNVRDYINPDTFKEYEKYKLNVPKYATEAELDRLHNEYLRMAEPQNYKPEIPPPEGMKRGGVAISKNPDTMMLELSDRKMAPGGLVKGLVKAAKEATEAERALPLRLPRALPKPLSEINAHAERVARQMMGEHVTSGKAGDTKNLAGRSMKESQRVKGLEYELVPTKNVPESQVVESKIGDINVALPGDFTVSDVELKSLMGEHIGSRQEGGSRYGLGHLEDEIPLFYASNEGPAQQVQNKVTDLYDLYSPERVMGHHMAMGPIATNFAQHFADANLRYIDYSKLRPQDMYQFDKIVSEGFALPKKNKKTGETTYKIVDFPDWPGLADPQAAYEAMKANPEMRKWFNKLMQTPSITEPLNLPNAQDVRYAITSPDLRDMEVNLTGHGVGRMVPGGTLTDTADHNTYAKGIRGIYEGHQDVLTPFPISFADAAQHIMSTQRPQDFTGTIQKVFPHQLVDQQYLDELGAYRRRIKELTGKKAGGAVDKPAGAKQPAAYIDGSEFVEAAKKHGIKDSMNNLNKIVDLVNKGLTVDDAARQVADGGMHKAAGGAISGDDLILEERPL